ncbi:hypothetical protein P171DRAFT_448625 [Karstenula rhodostoma CBS 690.94]|uniref:Uncharacterized protein n=1 Tax=Karstenula rhodostoma CBS 690.94 TaxID=1392251 RepID=A0A9P4P675_9PLEO|nr:hypothetical protein P171DRAFT_448625 [Karstenula rhodostoma CBS 690.94]
MSTAVPLATVFRFFEPFRDNILRMLLPSEISTLLSVLNTTVSEWERSKHMDIMYEIFQDIGELSRIQDLGLTIRIFGSDLHLLDMKIRDPERIIGNHRKFSIFVLISGHSEDGFPTLNKDFRSTLGNADAKGLSTDFYQHLPGKIADDITLLSRWMLCTPHPTGSLPGMVPGWIPMFNTHGHISLRTYISDYNGYKSRILHMDRTLTKRMFGHQNLLAHVSSLEAVCYLLEGNTRRKLHVTGRTTLNTLRDVYIPSQEVNSGGYVIVNSIQPLNSAIILHLP